MQVQVYATQGGTPLGIAKYLGDVRIASVTKSDPANAPYTALRESGEKTESFEFLGTKEVFYGFEYYVEFLRDHIN